MRPTAVFLDGAIGSGKTMLGRALSTLIVAGFIDGDDYSAPDRPWYGSSLSTSYGILQAAGECLRASDAVVIAYPLRRTNYVFFRCFLERLGVGPIFISLRASLEGINGPDRGRTFSSEERERIRVMLAEGYGNRAFSDAIVDTDRSSFAETAQELRRVVERCRLWGKL